MKRFATAIIALCVTASTAMVCLAGWQHDTNGWWYERDDGSYPAGQWESIGDYWYYFNDSGYMLADTTTPDGYYVDVNGRWMQVNEATDSIYTIEAYEDPYGNLNSLETPITVNSINITGNEDVANYVEVYKQNGQLRMRCNTKFDDEPDYTITYYKTLKNGNKKESTQKSSGYDFDLDRATTAKAGVATVDITIECYKADDGEEYYVCYACDEGKHISPDDVVTETWGDNKTTNTCPYCGVMVYRKYKH